MTESSTPILLLTTDLMFSSRISGAAEAAGCRVQHLNSVDELDQHRDIIADALVLVDLETAGPNIDQLTQQLPDSTLQQAIAYGPHVHEQRLHQARQAGFGTVLSRGRFASQVAALIHAWKNRQP